MTGAWFLAYVQQVLAPTLKGNDVVNLNNLTAHKISAVRLALEAKGPAGCLGRRQALALDQGACA